MNSIGSNIKNILLTRSNELAKKIVELQYSKQPEFWEPFGEKGKEISKRDAAYHLPFLAEAIINGDKRIFTNYVAWVKKLFKGLNFPDKVMISTLNCTRDVLQTELSGEYFLLVNEYIEAGLKQMSEPVPESEPYIFSSDKLGETVIQYNKALLAGDRKKASEIIFDEVDKGTSISDIYLHIFQKSQYEIGRLWLENKISVAKEHFCSAATQQIMSQLYPHIFSSERNGKKMIAANVGGELHEIGLRMVADFFEMDGWDTYYLGANTPAKSILQAIEENKADLVGLSIAIPSHISSLKDAIILIRKAYNNKVKILIGGYALMEIGENWKLFNADGYAEDARKAVQLGNLLTR